MFDIEPKIEVWCVFESLHHGLRCHFAISGNGDHGVDNIKWYHLLKQTGLRNLDCLRLARSDADDAGNSSIREYRLCFLKDLCSRVVKTHAAIDIWLSCARSADHNALEECRSSRRRASSLPNGTIKGLIYWSPVAAKESWFAGSQVECSPRTDKPKIRLDSEQGKRR